MKLYSKDATGCSWNGESYEPDADGAVDVPEAAAADLACHGFTTDAPAKAEQEAPLTGNPAKWSNDILASEAARLGIDTTLPRPALVKQVATARKAEADDAYTEAEAE
jgi:hypothetical protein